MTTSNIKKDYVELVELLQANQNKKVSTIMDDIIALTTRKSGGGANGSTVYRVNGEVVAIYCYYHKKYELISHVDYGKKANTASGLNTMCKEGVSNWTKQQRTAKKAESDLLNQLAEGKIEPSELTALRADIDETKSSIIAREDESHSFDTIEELEAFLNS